MINRLQPPDDARGRKRKKRSESHYVWLAEPVDALRSRAAGVDLRWAVVGFADLGNVEVYSAPTCEELNDMRAMALQRMHKNHNTAEYRFPVACKFVHSRLLERRVIIANLSRHWNPPRKHPTRSSGTASCKEGFPNQCGRFGVLNLVRGPC